MHAKALQLFDVCISGIIYYVLGLLNGPYICTLLVKIMNSSHVEILSVQVRTSVRFISLRSIERHKVQANNHSHGSRFVLFCCGL